MCGHSSATTDRKETLKDYGFMDDTYHALRSRAGDFFNAGASDTGKASKYYSAILSGDPNAVLAAAAPEANVIQKQADAAKANIANFGNRSGGTNAETAGMDTAARGQIADVIAGKRGEAAGNEAAIGARESGMGLGALEGASSTAANLGEMTIKSRELSAALHKQAVDQWSSFVKEAFQFALG